MFCFERKDRSDDDYLVMPYLWLWIMSEKFAKEKGQNFEKFEVHQYKLLDNKTTFTQNNHNTERNKAATNGNYFIFFIAKNCSKIKRELLIGTIGR